MEKTKVFYNFAGLTKVGDKVVAVLEGNETKDLVTKTVNVKGEDKNLSTFSIAVGGNLQKRFDYLEKKYDKSKNYDDTTFVTVNGWGDVSDTLEKVCEKGRKMEVFGILTEKSYNGQNGAVSYLELTIADRQSVRGLSPKKSTASASQNEEPIVNEDLDGDIPF